MHLQSTYTPHLHHIQSEAQMESSRTSAVELYCGNRQRIKAVCYFRRGAPSWMFDRILNATLPFTSKIGNIPWIVWRRSPEFLMTFPGMFGDIPRNVWRQSPEYLVTFPGMFDDIPGFIHSPKSCGRNMCSVNSLKLLQRISEYKL